MNLYRRNTFYDWFTDVGFIYLLVIALVTVIYFFQTIELVGPTFNIPAGTPERLSDAVLPHSF